MPGDLPDHGRLGAGRDQWYDVPGEHDQVVRRVPGRQQVERAEVGLQPGQVGCPLAGHRQHGGVDVGTGAVVAELGQPDRDPAGAAAGVEHPGAGRHQRGAQGRLAVDVCTGGREGIEPGRVVASTAPARGVGPAGHEMLLPWRCRLSTDLRAEFARRLSVMYGGEVPAYTTLVEVAQQVNGAGPATARAERPNASAASTGSPRSGTARSGSGSPRELAQVGRLFAAMGMTPVGFYDLRDADPSAAADRVDGVPAGRSCRAGAQPVPGVHLGAGARGPTVLRRRPAGPGAAVRRPAGPVPAGAARRWPTALRPTVVSPATEPSASSTWRPPRSRCRRTDRPGLVRRAGRGLRRGRRHRRRGDARTSTT